MATIRKTMNNMEIFNTATMLMEAFQKEEETVFPVKINFFLQKNITTITDMARDVEKTRSEIVQKYGQPSEEDPNQYVVPQENIEAVQKELEDLFNLEQEVVVNTLKIDWFDNINMSAKQVAAIAYMIEEEE